MRDLLLPLNMEPWLAADVVIVLCGVFEAVRWRRKRISISVQRTENMSIVLIICYGVVVLTLNWPGLPPISLSLWMQWAGVTVGIAGLALRLWCAHVTRLQATNAPKDSAVEYILPYGLYRVIRYPDYLGNLAVWCGSVMASGNLSALITVTVAMLGVYAVRMSSEEALLAQQLGAAYDKYRKHSWRLIPYLY